MDVQSGHGAYEPGEGDVEKWNLPIRLSDHKNRMFLEPPVGSVIKHAAVVESAICGGVVHDGEAAAVKQFRNEVRLLHLLERYARAFGQPFQLFKIICRDVLFLDADDHVDHLRRRELEAHNVELFFFAHFIDQVANVFPHVLPQKHAMLHSHFIRRALEVQHTAPLHSLNKPFPIPRRYRLSPRLGKCQNENQGGFQLYGVPRHGMSS